MSVLVDLEMAELPEFRNAPKAVPSGVSSDYCFCILRRSSSRLEVLLLCVCVCCPLVSWPCSLGLVCMLP